MKTWTEYELSTLLWINLPSPANVDTFLAHNQKGQCSCQSNADDVPWPEPESKILELRATQKRSITINLGITVTLKIKVWTRRKMCSVSWLLIYFQHTLYSFQKISTRLYYLFYISRSMELHPYILCWQLLSKTFLITLKTFSSLL